MSQKECGQCGQLFAPKRYANFCSPYCRDRNRYLRHKAEGKHVEWQYKHYAKRVYGLSLEQIEEMNKAQDYRCKLCDMHVSEFTGKKSKLCIDHCHKTGRVRGLLCEACNTMLGMARDNVETLKKAIKYLEESIND